MCLIYQARVFIYWIVGLTDIYMRLESLLVVDS